MIPHVLPSASTNRPASQSWGRICVVLLLGTRIFSWLRPRQRQMSFDGQSSPSAVSQQEEKSKSSHPDVQQRSDVKSQESGGDLILGDTFFPGVFSSFTAQIKGTDKHTENCHEYRCKYGYKSCCFHVNPLHSLHPALVRENPVLSSQKEPKALSITLYQRSTIVGLTSKSQSLTRRQLGLGVRSRSTSDLEQFHRLLS